MNTPGAFQSANFITLLAVPIPADIDDWAKNAIAFFDAAPDDETRCVLLLVPTPEYMQSAARTEHVVLMSALSGVTPLDQEIELATVVEISHFHKAIASAHLRDVGNIAIERTGPHGRMVETYARRTQRDGTPGAWAPGVWEPCEGDRLVVGFLPRFAR